MLRQSMYPDARTYLLHRAGPLGADVRLLLKQLEIESGPLGDTSARQALILALGEYTAEQFPADHRKEWTARLLSWYRDDHDPGVHAAIDWLLRHGKDGLLPRKLDWGQAKQLERIDRDLEGKAPQGGRRWYVNGQGQTMVLLGPGEFAMGSPLSEANRFDNELPHQRWIGRRFALASKKVTLAQFQRFLKANPDVKHSYTRRFSPDLDGPVISVTWYEAAQYCRWLSEQEGFEESDMVYPSVEEIEKCKDGKTALKMPANYLKRKGYRMPTEAEWEHACRAGAVSSRFYGSSIHMLGHYAWYQENVHDRTWPVGQKKPNGFGLFDMHGNTWDWCQDGFAPYQAGSRGKPAADEEDKRDVSDKVERVLRGGSFYSQATGLRCAFRLKYRPSARVFFIGFGLRVARTYD
jgi:formylglycine-generating enzyme required for sulfatase activity